VTNITGVSPDKIRESTGLVIAGAERGV